jgi:hypothetical protein
MIRRASCALFVGLVAGLGMATADPFEVRTIALPWDDASDVAVGDFNGDGLPDIATLNSYGPFTFECSLPPGPISCGNAMLLTVALNQGLGHFAPVRTTLAMCAPWTIVAGDFNADGRDDVIIGNRGARDSLGICNQASMSFYPGDGAGGFGTAQHIAMPDEPIDMAAGDFDGDGRLEAAVAFESPGSVGIFRVTPAGAFEFRATWISNGPLAALTTGDLDGDGKAEIVAGFKSDTKIAILAVGLGGALTLRESCVLTPGEPPPRAIAIGDFTGDHIPELAIGRPGNPIAEVSVLAQALDGKFCGLGSGRGYSLLPPGFGGRLAPADLDGDGRLDLATTDGFSRLLSMLGDGIGSFHPAAPMTTPGTASEIAVTDFSADGLADLVVAGPRFSLPSGASLVLINQAPMGDLMRLVMAGKDIGWNAVNGAVSYDIVHGDLGGLLASGGDFTASTDLCVADDATTAGVQFLGDPPPGTWWWFIGRANIPAGYVTYDSWGPGQIRPRDAAINAAASACP